MFSLRYLENELDISDFSTIIHPSYYYTQLVQQKFNEFMKKKDSKIISKIKNYLALKPSKIHFIIGFFVFTSLEMRLQKLIYHYYENSDESMQCFFIDNFEGLTPQQISKYKRISTKIHQEAQNKAIEQTIQLLVDGKIDIILELPLSHKQCCEKLMNFMDDI